MSKNMKVICSLPLLTGQLVWTQSQDHPGLTNFGEWHHRVVMAEQLSLAQTTSMVLEDSFFIRTWSAAVQVDHRSCSANFRFVDVSGSEPSLSIACHLYLSSSAN
jgi:hypothetical protein